MADSPPSPEVNGITLSDAPPPIGGGWSIFIDVIREITRASIAMYSVYYVLWMLYKFVEMSPQKDAVMNLVIGGIFGYLMGIGTFMFGGAMRSAMAAFQQQNK